MNELTAETAKSFLSRFGADGFGNLHDAIVRRIELRYTPAFPRFAVSIEVSVEDCESSANEGWINLHLDVDGADEFVLKESPRTSCDVIFRLHIDFSEDRVRLDFCAADGSADHDDRAPSDFLVVGQRCSWSVLPYNEGAN